MTISQTEFTRYFQPDIRSVLDTPDSFERRLGFRAMPEAASGPGGIAAAIGAARRKVGLGGPPDWRPAYLASRCDRRAAALCEVVSMVLLRVARADSHFCPREDRKIREFLVQECGVNGDFVRGLLHYQRAHIGAVAWPQIASQLRRLARRGDVDIKVLGRTLLRIAEEVMWADGETHSREREEIRTLGRLLVAH